MPGSDIVIMDNLPSHKVHAAQQRRAGNTFPGGE